MPGHFQSLLVPRRDWRAWVWVALAVLWLVLLWDRATNVPLSMSSLGVPYLVLLVGPLLAMGVHVAYPTRLGWGLLAAAALGTWITEAVESYERASWYEEVAKWEPGWEADFWWGAVLGTALLMGLFGLTWPRAEPPRHEEAA